MLYNEIVIIKLLDISGGATGATVAKGQEERFFERDVNG